PVRHSMSMAAGSCINARTAIGRRQSRCITGAFSGTASLPMKYTPLWRFENTWAIFSIFAYVISPWIATLVTISHSFQVYGDVGVRVCLIVALFGLGGGYCGCPEWSWRGAVMRPIAAMMSGLLIR